MTVTPEWIKENYDIFNQKYFGGRLPHNLKFLVNRSKKFWGLASYWYSRTENEMRPISITISNYFDSPEKIKLNTLLHEMVHIEEYTFYPERFFYNGKKVRGYDAHGQFFQSEAARINKDGWDIQKYVQSWEQEQSKLSDRQQQIQDKKLSNGITFYILEYATPYQLKGSTYKYGYCKVGQSNDRKYQSIFYKREDEFKCVYKYVSNSPEALKLSTNRGGAWYITNDINRVINTYKLKFVDQVLANSASAMPHIEYNGPINENKMIIKESKLRQIIRNTLMEMLDGNNSKMFKQDPMVHETPINDNEGIVSIE